MNFVPASRLIGLAAVIAALAAVAGPLAEWMPAWFALAAAAVLLAGADLVVSLLGATRLAPTLPPIVRFSKDRPGMVPISFPLTAGVGRRIRFGLGLPDAFEAKAEEAQVNLPAGTGSARIEWECTPRRRGRFETAVAAIETGSRLGFWRLRQRVNLACDLRVYPNLLSERRQLAALFLARGQQGAIVRRTVGRGREFEKLREYLPGDGFDEIHWKATAKRGRPVTKIFQAERTQEIYVVIDRSRLSARPLGQDGVTQTVLERYLTASLVLLLAAERQGDRFGLVAYDDRVRVFLRAGRGRGHYGAAREAALALTPSDSTPDMAEVVRHLRMQLRRRALLFFLTDLTDPVLAEDFTKQVRLLARQHLVFVSQLRAPGVGPLFMGAEVKDDAEVYARLAGHVRWAEGRALGQRLKPLGVTSAVLENETLAAQLVTQYLQVKRRQAL
ncbi:MAG: hypothetical protein JWM32_2184 [Verrucomicrobia bacterium]|nr:hypothetical protein [Verrucomicrobiota bacterium]